jgi:isopropylmalate/homocitrate/citramalate synthase
LRAIWSSDVEFSPEDGYRSDMDFLCRVIEAVIAEGATTINVPDTVGYADSRAVRQFHQDLARTHPQLSDKAIWSVHCHNDLGMAVANSLAGVKIGGARQVECTINGLGERAGNCSLEEIVMAVKTRKDYFGLEMGIDPQHILAASRMVSQTTGFVVQPNKAVVGANAFAHASRASTRTVCSRRATPTRSCAPKTWAGAPTRSCWASSAGAMRSSSGCTELGVGRWRVRPRYQCGVCPLQGTGRPQERDLRRGHPGLW